MKSLSKLFRVGPGPSSSHTIAPFNAAKSFLKLIPAKKVTKIKVTFYASLSCTAKGHHSDVAIAKAFAPIPTAFSYDIDTEVEHPLTMKFSAYCGEKMVKEATYMSLGGGELLSHDDPSVNDHDIYPFRDLGEVLSYMKKENIKTFKEFCLRFEDPSIDDYLMEITKAMFETVKKGLCSEGQIPANDNPRLQIMRTAKSMHDRAISSQAKGDKRTILMSSYAYAAAECSACGDVVVTSPTCGSSGVLPAVLYYQHVNKKRTLAEIRDSLYSAGIFGNIVKQNASIAGSIGGCQAEIGTATSMAAAALCYLNGLSLYQMEYAAECAMEHFLGLSCDPVDGYVIIPCIERNGVGATRAYDSYLYAKVIAPIRHNQVSFDDVTNAMKMTGDSLSSAYKETAQGGLAKILQKKK